MRNLDDCTKIAEHFKARKDNEEYTCETCKKKVKGYKGVTKHSQKYHHYTYKDKELKDMRLAVV
jgi:hypothetical protein